MSALLPCPTLFSDRLTLKPIVSEDAVDFFDLWSTDNFDMSAGFDKPTNLSVVIDSLAYFKTLNESGFYFKWSIRSRITEEFLGELECYPLKPQIRPWLEWGIGYSLKKSAWGQGYMTEAMRRILFFAFTETRIIRLKADVFEDNLRSIKLLKKLGFLFEGLQVSKNFSNGKFNDMSLMALSRDRYLSEHSTDTLSTNDFFQKNAT